MLFFQLHSCVFLRKLLQISPLTLYSLHKDYFSSSVKLKYTKIERKKKDELKMYTDGDSVR